MNKKTPNQSIGIASCSLSNQTTGLQLFPAGQFDAPRGSLKGAGPWNLNASAAAKLLAVLSKRQNAILIDYDHQSLLAADNGKPNPAAGWIDPARITYNENGLFATGFTWTDAAASSIAADEYRYLSPVFTYDKNTGEVLDIINVALTNNPALDGMQAVTLAAASLFTHDQPATPQDTPMDYKTLLLAALSLSVTATDEEITLATAALKSKDEEIAALKAQQPDPAQYAPVAALTAMQTELAALRANETERSVNDLINPALADGRLLPAQETWARDLGKSNLAALGEFLKTAQPIAALTGIQSKGKNVGTAGEFTDAEIAQEARQYHADQAALGINISIGKAVDVINKKHGVTHG